MYFKQFFDKKLAQTSYMVACQQTKEAIIIDPKRVLDEYEKVAAEEGFNITHGTETHIHADFASGLREAAKHCGGKLYVSDGGDDNWRYQAVREETVLLKANDV